MPSKSAKQAKFMRAVAHSPKFAKQVGVPQSVGKDYEMADKKTKKFGDGGAARKPTMPREPITGGKDTVPMTPERREFLKEMERRNKEQRDESAKLAKKATPYAKGGKVGESKKAMELRHARTLSKLAGEERKEAAGYKKGGAMKKSDKAGRALVKKSADTMGRAMMKYAKGGTASARADGIAQRGKTKGKMLAKGGMAKKGCK